MAIQTVYSFDPVTGEYTGETIAYESPLEPGVFHIPAYAVAEPPPAAGAGEVVVFDGARWVLQTIATPEPTEALPAPGEEAAPSPVPVTDNNAPAPDSQP